MVEYTNFYTKYIRISFLYDIGLGTDMFRVRACLVYGKRKEKKMVDRKVEKKAKLFVW